MRLIKNRKKSRVSAILPAISIKQEMFGCPCWKRQSKAKHNFLNSYKLNYFVRFYSYKFLNFSPLWYFTTFPLVYFTINTQMSALGLLNLCHNRWHVLFFSCIGIMPLLGHNIFEHKWCPTKHTHKAAFTRHTPIFQ